MPSPAPRGMTLDQASRLPEFADYTISELVAAVVATRTPPCATRHGISHYSLPALRASLRRVRSGDLAYVAADDTGDG